MQERLKLRSALFDKGLVLALAASVGFHVVAAWGAGVWFSSSSHLEPIQVISLRFLDEHSTSRAAPNHGQSDARAAPSKVPLSKKTASTLLRVRPSSGRTTVPIQKTLITQKPSFEKIPTDPPRPAPYPSAAKSLLTSTELSPAFSFKPKSSMQPEELTLSKGSPTDKPTTASPSTLSKSFAVAKVEPSSSNDRASRLESIRRRIQEALVYPRAARRFGWEGTAQVRIVLAPDGHLSNVTLESSSQIGILDSEILAAIRRAAPYPYVEGPIAIPVVFDLRAP